MMFFTWTTMFSPPGIRTFQWFVITYIIISTLPYVGTNSSDQNNLEQNHAVNKTFNTTPPVSVCEEPTSSKHTALATFNSLSMLLGIIGNFMVILVIQYSQLRKEPGYVLVTSLAVADFGVCLFVTSAKVHIYLHNGNFCSDFSFCVINHIADGLFPTASITHLLFICLNKFFSVNSPYKYHIMVTYRKEIIVVLFVWFYCFMWTSAGMITWETNSMFSLEFISDDIGQLCYNTNDAFYVCAAICVFIAPVLITGTLYAILLVIVMEKMKATPTSIARKRGARTVILVFTGWVICWMPHFSMILVDQWNPQALISFERTHSSLYEFISTFVSDVLPCINSCINPFIYVKTSSSFRHALKDSYLKLMKKPRHRRGSCSTKPGDSWSRNTVVRYNTHEEVILLPQITSGR